MEKCHQLRSRRIAVILWRATYHTVLRKAVQSKPGQNSVFAMASLYIHTHSPKSYTHKGTLYLYHYSQYYNSLPMSRVLNLNNQPNIWLHYLFRLNTAVSYQDLCVIFWNKYILENILFNTNGACCTKRTRKT